VYASAGSADNAEETTPIDLTVNPFVVGANVIAVLVKQSSGTSSDVSFDLELTLTREPIANADECALGIDDCDPNATCTDTPASFTCACNAGYTGSGTTCTLVTASDGGVVTTDGGATFPDASTDAPDLTSARPSSATSGCACEVGASAPPPSALLVFAVLALLISWRRRRA
jgi:MYXO-CTERM domain-containing protein